MCQCLKGKTIKEIARDLRVSRNTVRKVLRSRTVGPHAAAAIRLLKRRPFRAVS